MRTGADQCGLVRIGAGWCELLGYKTPRTFQHLPTYLPGSSTGSSMGSLIKDFHKCIIWKYLFIFTLNYFIKFINLINALNYFDNFINSFNYYALFLTKKLKILYKSKNTKRINIHEKYFLNLEHTNIYSARGTLPSSTSRALLMAFIASVASASVSAPLILQTVT